MEFIKFPVLNAVLLVQGYFAVAPLFASIMENNS